MHITSNFILTTTENFFSKTNLIIEGKDKEILSEFINDPQNLLIQSYVQNENKIVVNPQIQPFDKKCLIFYKNSANEVQDGEGASLSNMNVITLSKNAAESLYYTLKQVYSPLLTAENDVYSIKLQKQLSDLESLLKTLTHGKVTKNDVNIIFNIQDEIDYWVVIGQKANISKKEKEAVTTFCDLFHEIQEEVSLLQSSNLLNMRESAENIGALLDDVWRFTSLPYAQLRMTHIFDIIGHSICSLLQKTLSSIDLWKSDNDSKEYEILALLSDSLKVIQTWTSACRTLTETYWPNYALHPWDGKPYVPLFCERFEARLKEISNIRSTHSQLTKLLSKKEAVQLNTDTLFSPFQNINIWMYNGSNTSWESAVAKFSGSLRPAEVKIAEKLKPRFHNTSTKQMLYEFLRYRALICCPAVRQALGPELDMFVSSLLAMLRAVRARGAEGARGGGGDMHQPPEMSPLVLQIQWAKQTEAKVKEVQTCAEKYLKEFDGSSQVLELATQLLKELKSMYTQLHEEWCRDLQAEAKNGQLIPIANKPVVEFNSESKMMEVMFNPRLVWLELEARSLVALGFPSPPAAAALDSIAAALTQARALQQVASFHNSLGERMIPSTRPMMLAAALELSALVRDQRAVYWGDAEQLQNYTDKLKKAVMKLESQNTYLTTQHASIRKIVENLMDSELLVKQAEWKKGVHDIRSIIEKVAAEGRGGAEAWAAHWDRQLHKALQCQYMKALLSLHKHFPHVKVHLVLRGHVVKVQPPMEELRVQHYHQLRRLVSLPAQFVGVQDNLTGNSIFTDIVDKHSWLGNIAVKQLEEALCGVERACAAWTRAAALACVPRLAALCDQLRDPNDWDLNFKACKAYGQAVAKMTFEDEKIHWISIGTTSLRREFEAQTRNLWTCLISSLQASCRSDATELEAFIANATVMLENKALPKNAKELSEISSKQQALQQKMPEMEKTIEALKKKGHMLHTWGGDASVDGTVKEWQKVRELMLSHQQMFEHQADLVKSSLKGEWDNLNGSVEAWLSRWRQWAARHDATGGDFAEMNDRCRSVLAAREQWLNYVADKDDLVKECEKFNMDTQLTDSWQQAEKLITEYVDLWAVFKDYSEDLESIAEQEWSVFQKKLHLLDEFTTKWKGLLEPFTSVTLFIQQELEKYSDLSPLLKYVVGGDFTERHWREVFGLLQIDCKRPDTLRVKDLLAVATNIKKHLKELQKISTSAASESAVRSALNELEIWFAGARLAVIYYTDKANRQTPIVKDFKEILNKIEEQQWVVASVSGGGGGGGGGAGEACGAWEARLRTAGQLARAAHHAQRRYNLRN